MSIADSRSIRLTTPAGLTVVANENGSIRRMDCGEIVVNLFPGNELEGGTTNLFLRREVDRWGVAASQIALLGPRSPTRWQTPVDGRCWQGTGEWEQLRYAISLVLSDAAAAWFWHVEIENTAASAQNVDLIYVQDVALAPYGAVRLNEYYVSQYLDHTPLMHDKHGPVVASRQNQAVGGRYPWSAIGSLGRAVSYATDALQVYGLEARAGAPPRALAQGLPGKRLQHEHSMVGIQEQAMQVAAGARRSCGFFGSVLADHPSATAAADLSVVDRTVALAAAAPPAKNLGDGRQAVPSLFTTAAPLAAVELGDTELTALFGTERHDVEIAADGALLSFFHGADRHVVLRAKELRVQRPHGHLLRTGTVAIPDETALTSTTWMNGVFHSMVTQGHVSINRFLSTTHSYLGLFRAHGQRVFCEVDGQWQLLDVPSAMEMAPDACRWVYKHAGGVVEVRSAAISGPHALSLGIRVLHGAPMRFLIAHHVALNGDDGNVPGAALWTRTPAGIAVRPAPGSELAQRFAHGDFLIAPTASTRIARVGGDELLFVDGKSRHQPYLCLLTEPTSQLGIELRGRLVAQGDSPPLPSAAPALGVAADISRLSLQIRPPAGSALAGQIARLQNIIPWFVHNALIHYLSPRGLEQYSGGGWGTRDVSQGPVELLLAAGHAAPVRDLLLRVFAAQNPDGDWPQWFMFFARERAIRAGDSHGDIVFWPLLAMAQYLLASGDASLLDESVRFFDAKGAAAGELATLWQHAQRSLTLIRQRAIAGTSLAAYGHGDWNDSLQPADPNMREHMCSAWTVTLHHQLLTTLAQALRSIGRTGDAAALEDNARRVHADFQRLLIVDGVIPGYALFDTPTQVRYLLHPRDATSGVHYSSLAMIHAILEDMLTPEQARAHLQLIDAHLTGPDGVRLFDRPLDYHGGPQRFFQRAESATFFGREIGLMYMHAHLRYAQALAHMGEAERFFKALCQSNPIGLRDIVPPATLRQANCYYSSSDAAFADRQQASAEYGRVVAGTVALDGGWRVYSSGAGIALGLIVRRFLGLSFAAQALEFDPVMPSALDGLEVATTLSGHAVKLKYRVGLRGCGVKVLTVNGQPLTFTRLTNAFRDGGVRVEKAGLLSLLTQASNEVQIEIG